MTRTKPWNSLNINDTIFFKNSGEMITLKAKIKDIMQIDLQDQSFEKIYHIYYKEMGIEEEEYKYFYKLFKMKKYYVLIFLKNSTLVKPFQIDKKGFGNQSAWIVVDNINYLKV